MGVMNGCEEDLDQCIICGNCSRVCPRTDPFTVMRDLIYIDRRMGLNEAFLKTGFNRFPAVDRGVPPEWTGDDAYVMLGCVVNAEAPFIEYAASKAMEAVGVHAMRLPNEICCLHPVMYMDMPEVEKRRRRTSMLSNACGKEVVTLCGGCSEDLETMDPKVQHIIKYMHARIDRLPVFPRKVRVGMEPGCSVDFLSKEFREILERMNCEVVNTTKGCCGKIAPVRIPLMKEREEECRGAEVIVVACPNCFTKFDQQEGGIPVVHLAELIAAAAGHPESFGCHRIPVPDLINS